MAWSIGRCLTWCISRRIARHSPRGGPWAAHSPAELWSDSGLLLHIGDGVCSEALRQEHRFSEKTQEGGRFSSQYLSVLTRVTNESRCWSKHSHRDCGVRCRPELSNCLDVRPATHRRRQCAAEHASDSAARRAIDRHVERGVDVATDSGAQFPGLGAVGRHVEAGVHHAAESQAKSLIDSHIDGRFVLRVEPRSQPGSDSPPAGASLRYSPGLSGRVLSGPTGFLRAFRVRRQTIMRKVTLRGL